MATLKARAELPKREWVEFEIETDSSGKITGARWKAWGCHRLLETAAVAASQIKNNELSRIHWAGLEHWDLLVQEVFDRLQGKFQLPIADAELCHCRKIPAANVDQAIVLGAHTPERVTKFTSASSGCGTCRPEVEKLIRYRLKKTG